MNDISVRQATPADTETVSEILARAFAADPVLTSLMRDTPDRTARMARYFELECRLGFRGNGEAWIDGDKRGAAIWRSPGRYPEPLGDQLRMLPQYLRLFPREFIHASRAINVLARAHPREPHWYLFAVGVVPESQGEGRGGALIRPVLERCDAEGVPAYTEASSADNARLYARLSFELVEELEIPGGVTVRRMWRDPRRS